MYPLTPTRAFGGFAVKIRITFGKHGFKAEIQEEGVDYVVDWWLCQV
jgi:hypothetical protein